MTRTYDAAQRTLTLPPSGVAALVLAVAFCAASLPGCQRDEQNANQPAEADETTSGESNSHTGALLDLLEEKKAIEQADKGVKYDEFNEAIAARKEQNRRLQPVEKAIEAEMRRQCPDLFEVYDKKEELTEVQWPEYAATLPGTRIVAVGYVEEVEPISDYGAEGRVRKRILAGLSDDDPAVKAAYQERLEAESETLKLVREHDGLDGERKLKQRYLEEVKQEVLEKKAKEWWAEISDPALAPCRVIFEVPALLEGPVVEKIAAEAEGPRGSKLKKGTLYRLILEIRPQREGQDLGSWRNANLPGLYFELVDSELYDGDQ